MSEEKEPQGWDEFYSATIGKLQKVIESRRDDRLRAAMAPEKRILELRGEVNRGMRTRNFLNSPFWIEDLEPFLRGEAKLKPWIPGDPLPLEEVSTMHLWNSGKVHLLSMMVARFGKWVESGDSAARALAEEEKKKELFSQR